MRCITFIFALLHGIIWRACLITSLNLVNVFLANMPLSFTISLLSIASVFSFYVFSLSLMDTNLPNTYIFAFDKYLIRMRNVNIQYPHIMVTTIQTL
jgi:hypothetical protein